MFTVLFKDIDTRKTTRKISGWITIDSAKWSANNTRQQNEYAIITEQGKQVYTNRKE